MDSRRKTPIMQGIDFPIFKTRTGGEAFSLEDPLERRKYFELKAGPAMEKLRTYLTNRTFVGILLGPKNSGKGTYATLFREAVGSDKVAHVSIGDIVRDADVGLQSDPTRAELVSFLEKRYRGFVTVPEAVEIITGRSTTKLLPTEVILALIEREIDRIGRKAIFIDGFPRNTEQISYSLFLRSLMGYRSDPDFLVFIDVPEAVIDERMKFRVICPNCKTPRNTRVLRTKKIGYDKGKNQFYLVCDNPACGDARMVAKEGDHLGIEAVRERIDADFTVMRKLLDLKGVPKVFLRNSVPIDLAGQYLDGYEITPAYRYELVTEPDDIRVVEEPWSVVDDNGRPSYSLLPAPVAVAMINQIASVLNL